MRPVFTIHGGEYLTAEYLEHKFGKKLRVWVPSKDDGIDLLISSRDCKKTVSLQVKSSKSYAKKGTVDALGWWRMDKGKLAKSAADFWVFITLPFADNAKTIEPFFIIIPPKELLKRLRNIKGALKVFNADFSIKGRAVAETRGMNMKEIGRWFSRPTPLRDFSKYLGNWDVVLDALK